MIVYKQWKKKMFSGQAFADRRWEYEGWFLLGFIPLYVKRIGIR